MTDTIFPKTWRSFLSFNRALVVTRNNVQLHDMDQFLSFKNVSPETFEYIKEHRSNLKTHFRLAYYPDIECLIVKVLSEQHEVLYGILFAQLSHEYGSMGLSFFTDFCPLQSKTFIGLSGSRKQADASSINKSLRPRPDDWPFFVIEVGYSESYARLKMDAHWWMYHSRGDVQIVLLIKVRPAAREVLFEKYFPRVCVPQTRARSQQTSVYEASLASATLVEDRNNSGTVTGDQLVLEFQRMIGRPPTPPERDIQFLPGFLVDLARVVLT